MKLIGFIDYFLDEWHADQYVQWINKGTWKDKFQVNCAWAAMDKPGGLTTKEWCRKHDVHQAASIEDVIERCDGLLVLSPDHTDQHWALSEAALSSGKPTYVDKTFAPDLETALRMFALAESSGTPMYSTSALRYASELTNLDKELEFVITRGPGLFANYAVHQLEMIVKLIGTGAKSALCTIGKDAPMIVYKYKDNRKSVIHCIPWADFTVTVHTSSKAGCQQDIREDFWPGFIEALLHFYENGQPPVRKEDTCEVTAMIEAGQKAIEMPGRWIPLPGIE